MKRILGAIAASAALATLAFIPLKASARACGDDKQIARCGDATASAPVQLDRFMDTWKPASASTSGSKRTKTSRRSRHRGESQKVAATRKSTRETRIAAKETAVETKTAAVEPAPAATAPVVPAVTLAAAEPEKTVETDGIAVTSFNEVNELDQASPRIQVVAFSDVNEIDLTAPPPPSAPAAAETVSQAFGQVPDPDDHSWIGKLLLAIAGTLALAGGTRFLVA